MSGQVVFIGQLKDSLSNEHMPYATIALKQQDSILQFVYSNEEGGFSINAGNLEKNNTYQISINYLGYEDYEADVIYNMKDTFFLNVIYLNPSTNKLGEIIVTDYKPFIRVEGNKVVVEVRTSPLTSSSNAFEILKNTPGVAEDITSGSIMYLGKRGVRILVDGKDTYLSGDELSQYLSSINGDDVENIELIATPGASYDASTNSGIINIITKKGKGRIFKKLSINQNLTKATFFRTNTNLSYLQRFSEKLLLGARYNFNQQKYLTKSAFTRNSNNATFEQEGIDTTKALSNALSFFGTLSFSNKSELNFSANSLLSNREGNGRSKTLVNSNIDSNKTDLASDGAGDSGNFIANANYTYTLDTNSTTIKINVDFAKFDQSSNTDLLSVFSNSSDFFRIQKNTADNRITAVSLDLNKNSRIGQLSLGTKFSNINNTSIFEFFKEENNIIVKDELRSNNFKYNERIYAGYFEWKKAIKDYNFTGGIRVEASKSEGLNFDSQEILSNSIFEFFPSFSIQRKIGKYSLSLNYSRAIFRPDYRNLNTFVFVIDDFSEYRGNPTLRPQISQTVELGFTNNHWFYAGLYASRSADYMQQIPTQDNSTNIITNSEENIGNSKYVGVNLSIFKPLTKWWYFNLSGGYFYNRINDLRDDMNTTNTNGYQGYLYNQNSFSLPFNVKLDLSYNYTPVFRRIWKIEDYSVFNIGVSRSFKKLNVSLLANDIFDKIRSNSNTNYQDLDIVSFYKQETSMIRLTLNWSFGGLEEKYEYNINTGIEDEKGRNN